MPRPKNKEEVFRRLCVACGRDVENFPDDEFPAYCYLNDPKKALYYRRGNEWVMPCHTSLRIQWVVERIKTKKKPKWNYRYY